MFILGRLKDAIKEYEKKISQKELEELMQSLGEKYGIKIKNAGNDVMGFIPHYTEPKEGELEKYIHELTAILKEKYSLTKT